MKKPNKFLVFITKFSEGLRSSILFCLSLLLLQFLLFTFISTGSALVYFVAGFASSFVITLVASWIKKAKKNKHDNQE